MTRTGPETAPAVLRTRLAVMTGNATPGPNGILRRIEAATIVIKSTDGARRTIALQQRTDGHWWVPDGARQFSVEAVDTTRPSVEA